MRTENKFRALDRGPPCRPFYSLFLLFVFLAFEDVALNLF